MTALTFADWLASRNRSTKPLNAHTLRGKLACVATVRRIACESTSTPPGAMSDAELARWLESPDHVEALCDRLAATRKQGTVRNVLLTLATFERYATACGYTRGFAPFTAPPPPEPVIQTFTAAERDLIERAAAVKGYRWHLFVNTLAGTGARIGSILNVRWDDVILDHDQPHLVLTQMKGGGQGFAPLNRKLSAMWASAPAEMRCDSRRHFSRSVSTYPFPWTYNNAREQWATMLKALSIPHRSPHKLRHTLATSLVARDVPILAVSRILGHSNVATTDRFYVRADALRFGHLLD